MPLPLHISSSLSKLSRIVMDLRLHPVCKLNSYPDIVIWMLEEDKILLDQRWKSLLLIAITAARVSSFLCPFPKFQFPEDETKRVKWHLHTQYVTSKKRNPGLRDPESFSWSVGMPNPVHQRRHSFTSRALNKPTLCPSSEFYFYFSRLFAIQQSMKK